MHKKLLFIALLIFSFAITACSSVKSEVSVSSINENPVISAGESESESSSLSASSTTSASVSESFDYNDADEAVPVDDEETANSIALSEAFLKDYDQMEGNYDDETSKRATARIESFGCEVQIVIIWPESATGHKEWEMTGTYKDGKLVYDNCTCMTVNSTDPQAPQYEVVYLDGKGYFEARDGKLLWTGAEEDSCKECVFVKK